MEQFRLIKDIENNGAMQMSIDEAILNARILNKVPNTLRFYYWKPSAVTIGYFQSIQKEVNIKKAELFGIDIIRRYTGGGAVFHDKEITYSLIVDDKTVGKNILDSYEFICDFIITALKKLGLKASFHAINDIIVNNKKISGNAQTRRNNIVLQHGTILLDVNFEKMFSLLKIPDEKIKYKLINKAKERVTSIKNELGFVDKRKVRQALVNAFNFNLQESKLTLFEKETANKLYKNKYSTREWNYKR